MGHRANVFFQAVSALRALRTTRLATDAARPVTLAVTALRVVAAVPSVVAARADLKSAIR